MCGRFASFLPTEALQAIFGTVNPLPNAVPTWNLSPGQDALVVRWRPDTRERYLNHLRWGLVSPFTTAPRAVPKPFTARAELVQSNGLFRASFAWQRCLVPANAFYEWTVLPNGRQPYAVARADGAPLALAGIWSGWKHPTRDGGILSFAILTTAANATLRELHDRMPVVVEEPDWPVWFGEEEGAPTTLLQPAAEHVLRFWRVNRAVNNVWNDGPDLLDRVDDPHAPPPSSAPAGANPA